MVISFVMVNYLVLTVIFTLQMTFYFVIETNNTVSLFYGHLAAQNSIFTSANDSIFNSYRFYGSDSGNNVIITCGINETCTIECYSNSCSNNFTIICNDCILTVDCQNAQKSDICPNGYATHNNNTHFFLPSLANVRFTTLENSLNVCNDSSDSVVINCGSYQECASGAVSLSEINSTLCCGGNNACYDSGNMTTTIDNTDVAIRFDGAFSFSDFENYILTKNGGDLYFTGSGATRYMTGNIEGKIGKTNMYCTGQNSCINQIIKNVDELYCVGHQGCFFAQLIENIGNNVWAYGYQGAIGATILNV